MIQRVREKLKAMRLWMKLALGSLAAGLAVIVFSWLMGSLLLAPALRVVKLPPSIFKGSEVQFQSRSGAHLKGNLLPGKSGQGAVILMHGIRGNRGDLAEHAEF